MNDWGYQAYFLKAKKSDAGTWSVRDQDQTERLKKGDRLHVLWPDGRITLETIESKPRTETIHEQGGPMQGYEVKSEELFVTVTVNGLASSIPIDQLYLKRAE